MPAGRALYVEIDRDAASRYGITVAAIDNTLYDAFGQRIVSTIFNQTSQIRVILEADERSVPGIETLSSLRVPGAGGAEDAPLPKSPNPYSVNLYDNIQKLNLNVTQIVGLHGPRVATLADLRAAIGQPPLAQ